MLLILSMHWLSGCNQQTENDAPISEPKKKTVWTGPAFSQIPLYSQSDGDLANKPELQGADYILGADIHERVRKPIQGTYAKVTEPGAFGSFIAKLDVVIENGIIKDQNYELLDVDPERYKPEKEMLQLVEKISAPYKSQLNLEIGRSKTTLTRYDVIETNMENMVTDSLAW